MDGYTGAYDSGDYQYSASGAAISVAVMLAVATVVLIAMKKSGFRAMVAVGRA